MAWQRVKKVTKVTPNAFFDFPVSLHQMVDNQRKSRLNAVNSMRQARRKLPCRTGLSVAIFPIEKGRQMCAMQDRRCTFVPRCAFGLTLQRLAALPRIVT
jgi:hypothetical protein